MEACEKEHLDISTSNSEEKQSDSFNSSKLDSAMDELLTQDVHESYNDSRTTDLMDEITEPRHAIQKLKCYTARKILRRAKYLRKKNYFFINSLASTCNTVNLPNESSRSKTNDTLHKLDESTSQKIKKVVDSGNLTIQRLGSLETKHRIPLGSKTKIVAPSSKLNHLSYESGQSSSTSLSFPKAIVYPDTKKLNVQSTKTARHGKMSFNEVFTKAAEEQIKTKKTIEQAISKSISNKPKNRILLPKDNESSEVESSDPKNGSSEKEPFKYLIPQNLLASQNDEKCTSSNASTSKSNRNSVSSDENQDLTHSVIPDRPQINYDLIDALADYRVIARYLFNKLNVPPIDFDGTDDYINLYKLSRN